MKRIAHIVMLVMMLTSMTSCKFLFRKPVVERIHDFRVKSINPDKTELELSLSVRNPNGYKLKLRKLDLELLNREREKIGVASLQKAVEIRKKKSNSLTFAITLDTRPTVKMINHSDQKLFLYLSGKGNGKVLCTSKNFEFEEPYEMDFRDQLKGVIGGFSAGGQDIFKLKRSYVEKLGITETELRVDFLIMNPYGLMFKLKGFPANIVINGKEAGKGQLLAPLNFDETVYSREGSMVFKVSNFKSIVGAVKGALSGEISYAVQGDVQIEAFGMDFSQPYGYKGEIPVSLSDIILN